MVYILTGTNKTASVRPFSLIVNSLNAISQPGSTDLLLNSKVTDYSIYNKDLFMKETY